MYIFIYVNVCIYERIDQEYSQLSARKPFYVHLYPPSFRFVYLIMIPFFPFHVQKKIIIILR
jgi:hypothetical protein